MSQTTQVVRSAPSAAEHLRGVSHVFRSPARDHHKYPGQEIRAGAVTAVAVITTKE